MADSTEKMREEFEAGFCKEFGFGRLTASSNPDAAQMLKAAEWAWQASRTALVIALPVSVGYDGYEDGPLFEKQAVLDSIEAAGVKVKP